ncbi:conjugal transfer protein TraG N-terminal domain-containing protein, partial [Thiolapillus sp.]|uniref:conjugal transfer protein TraG N-terminal domain-containing protein n=1 Tax=Thiolapillus sp. TaxID=2017437 RepID=UPI003AF86B2E
RQVPGWRYNSVRDVDYDPDLPHQWGQPWCSEWWTDTNHGLLTRISALPEASTFRNGLASMTTSLAGWFPSMSHAARKAQDIAVRKALSNSMVESMASYQPDNMESAGRGSALWGTAQSLAATAGAASANFSFGTMLLALKPMLPIAQAILLMIVYALLPLIVVMSGYSLSMLVLAGLGIFTINFWTVLWKLAQWIDEKLMVAMFDGVGAIDRAMAALANDGLLGSTTKDFLIDTLFAMLLIGMPLIWTMLMGWVGLRIGEGMNKALSTTTESSKKSGEKGPGLSLPKRRGKE